MAVTDALVELLNRNNLMTSQYGMVQIPLPLVEAMLQEIAPTAKLSAEAADKAYAAFLDAVPIPALLPPSQNTQIPTVSPWVQAPTAPLSELAAVDVYLGATNADGSPVHDNAPLARVYVPRNVPVADRQRVARDMVDFNLWAANSEIPIQLLESKSKKAQAEVASIVEAQAETPAEEPAKENPKESKK